MAIDVQPEAHLHDNSVSAEVRYCVYAFVILAAAATGLARIATVTSPWNVSTPILSANDCSRWCMVYALVERGTFRIDDIMNEPGWFTVDHIYKDGHFYSTKPPLLQVLVAGIYWVLKKCTGWTLLSHTREVVRTILIFTNLLPMVISLILFAWIGERYAKTDWTRLYFIHAAAWGTFLSTFVVTLNNHTVAAFCVLCGAASLLKILDGSRSPGLFALAGISAGSAFAFDLPAGLFALGITVLTARASLSKCLRFVLPSIAIPVIAHFVTNYLETGGLKPFYAYFGTEYYNYTLNGHPSYWSNPSGIDRGLDSTQFYLFNMIIGHHGILSLTPCFLITLNAWLEPRADSRLCDVQRFAAIQTVILIQFYLLQTENYNYGGVSCGLRWMFWLIPLWLIGMLPTLDRWVNHPWHRRLAMLLLAASIFSATSANSNPWSHPWLYTWWEYLGWIDYQS